MIAMTKPEPMTYTLYAVYDEDPPELQSVQVIDTGGKRLKVDGEARSDLAFGCGKTIERGKYSNHPAEAWLQYVTKKNGEVSRLQKQIKTVIELAELGLKQIKKMQAN